MTVETLKEAIVRLPEEERHSLALWLNGLDCDEWDREMAEDFSPEGAVPICSIRSRPISRQASFDR
jgi:hypothetical protein